MLSLLKRVKPQQVPLLRDRKLCTTTKKSNTNRSGPRITVSQTTAQSCIWGSALRLSSVAGCTTTAKRDSLTKAPIPRRKHPDSVCVETNLLFGFATGADHGSLDNSSRGLAHVLIHLHREWYPLTDSPGSRVYTTLSRLRPRALDRSSKYYTGALVST